MDNRDGEQFEYESDLLPLRRKVPKRILIIGVFVLVVCIVLGGVLTVRSFSEVSNLSAPTPTLAPGSNLFYVVTSPSWGSISIDGHSVHLSSVNPAVAGSQPLVLSYGSHQILWDAYPFSPQRCTIFVPPQLDAASCLANEKIQVPSQPGLAAFMITFTATTAMLPVSQRAAVLQAAQSLFDTMQATTIVQLGEQYADLQSPNFIATAAQPLRATLHFQLDTNPNSNATCVGDFIGQSATCEIQGQNCHQLCMQEDPQDLPSADSWDVVAVMRPTWDYTTLSGQVVARDQPDASDNSDTEYGILLFISWYGSSWHVSINDKLLDPACATASGRISYNANLTTEESNPTVSVDWSFSVGSNRANGCLAIAAKDGSSAPIAYGLYRFGIFYAVDTAAHHYWPNLPVANSYEHGIARELGAP
jgi:hypothetical protein